MSLVTQPDLERLRITRHHSLADDPAALEPHSLNITFIVISAPHPWLTCATRLLILFQVNNRLSGRRPRCPDDAAFGANVQIGIAGKEPIQALSLWRRHP